MPDSQLSFHRILKEDIEQVRPPSPVLSPTRTFSHATLEYPGYAVTVGVTLSWCYCADLSVVFKSCCKNNIQMNTTYKRYKCLITVTNCLLAEPVCLSAWVIRL